MYTVFDPHFLHLSGKTEDYLDLAVQYGIGGIGVDSELLDDEPRALEGAKQVWDRGLGWSIMFTPVDFYAPATDDQIFEEGLECFKPVSYTHLDVYKRQLPVSAVAMYFPSRIAVTRSAMVSTSSSLWEIKMTATPSTVSPRMMR